MGKPEFVSFSVMDNHFQVRYYPHQGRRYELYRVEGEKRLHPSGEVFQMYRRMLDDYLESAARLDLRDVRSRDVEL
jgi:hypothetical protein